MSPRFVGLRRSQAGFAISYTNDSPANRHGLPEAKALRRGGALACTHSATASEQPGEDIPSIFVRASCAAYLAQFGEP